MEAQYLAHSLIDSRLVLIFFNTHTHTKTHILLFVVVDSYHFDFVMSLFIICDVDWLLGPRMSAIFGKSPIIRLVIWLKELLGDFI